LGCGNGWYLRKLAKHYPHVTAIGLDGFEENIRQATQLADADNLQDRLNFKVGDIYQFQIPERADLIAMNRALHHVWDDKDNVFKILADHLKPGGVAVIWEPRWPASRSELRQENKRPLAFQNLAEHVQGNHFLQAQEIQDAFHRVGMNSNVHYFLDNVEMVIVGVKA
jgi:SAM-dependent methyltransferase